MHAKDFRFGFRVLGDCRRPRLLVDAAAAMVGYAVCDPRCALDSESYLSAFQFAGDFREYLAATGSTREFAGPCWTPLLWFDIDRDGDLPAALEAARRLCVYLTDRLDVSDGDALVFISGGKGFHVGIATTLWTPAPGIDLHRVARRFAESVALMVGIEIDIGVYSRVQCFRAPNSRHPKTGLHKRRLSVDELLHLSPDAIVKLAVRPEPFELPTPTRRSEAPAQLWTTAAELVRRETEAKAERLENGDAPTRLNRSTLEFIRNGATVGDRHRLCYSAAANLAEFGAPLPLCFALVEESALDCGLPPADVRRAIENGWSSATPAATGNSSAMVAGMDGAA